MRTEQEMFDLILQTARADDRIRAVYLNGSRTNPDAPKDLFQDYDIVYVVTETAPFIQDATWIDRFGRRLYWQEPDKMDALLGKDCDFSKCYGWLMQFADGNRLDLHVIPVEAARREILADKLCRILLDKDHLLPAMEPATDRDYWIKPPTEAEFSCTCNEFWWCLNNVGKGLWREELPYVLTALNDWVRPMLLQMITWKAGLSTRFQKSAGKCGKYLSRYLPKETYEAYLATYPRAVVPEIWQAVWVLCDLFEETSRELARAFSFPYHETEAQNARFFLETAQKLPRDAAEILPTPPEDLPPRMK